MKEVDFTKCVTNSIYRGANSGIEIMESSCFFSFEKEIAEDYALMNQSPCLYSFDISGLKFLIVDNNDDLDDGVEWISEDEFNSFDGVRTKSYSQAVFFGEFDCNNGKFSKTSYEDVILKSNSLNRRYDR